MLNRTRFTIFTPLPSSISRETALAFLHDPAKMIQLNPHILEHNPIPPPTYAPLDEREHVWYSIVENISQLFGVRIWNTSFTCSFHILPTGVVTHSYASLGVDVKSNWSVGGVLPNERQDTMQVDIGTPSEGLYLREDVEMGCNILMAGWIQQTMRKSHASLVMHFAKSIEFSRIDP